MRFGVYAPLSGEYDVAAVAALAREAEAAGWDGFFVWDNLMATFDGTGVVADTTVALTAVATATRRLRIGALVTPLARRRPWKYAKELATLDALSGGRLVAGVGLGAPTDFWAFGDEQDERVKAAMLDEALEVVAALWGGEDVHHEGRHFTLRHARLLPMPVQRPRIPVWVAGSWPGTKPFERAARWDGVAPVRAGEAFSGLAPDELRACAGHVAARRTSAAPFDVVHFATGGARDAAVADYAAAGATWWLASTVPGEESLDAFRARVAAGPPG